MKLATQHQYVVSEMSLAEYKAFLVKNGYRWFGKGSFGTVYIHRQHKDHVIKIADYDLGYAKFAEEVINLQREGLLSNHLPRIYGAIHVGRILPTLKEILKKRDWIIEKDREVRKRALNKEISITALTRQLNDLIRDIKNLQNALDTREGNTKVFTTMPERWETSYSVYVIERLCDSLHSKKLIKSYGTRFYQLENKIESWANQFHKRAVAETKKSESEDIRLVARVLEAVYRVPFMRPDLHAGNVMLRGNTYVLTDPVMHKY